MIPRLTLSDPHPPSPAFRRAYLFLPCKENPTREPHRHHPGGTEDPAALEAACRRLNLPLPTRGKVQLFDRIAEGAGIQPDVWCFPIRLTT